MATNKRSMEELLAENKELRRRLAISEGKPSSLAAATDGTGAGQQVDAEQEAEKSRETLLRLNRLYAVLSETNKAIVRSKDRETLFAKICKVAVEQGGFHLAWIGVVDEKSRMVQPVAAHGMTDYLDKIRISVKNDPHGRGPTGAAIRHGSYSVCNDLLSAPCFRPWRKRALSCGFKSSASIALKMHGKPFGALNICAGEKDFFRWQFANLLEQMAEDISFALDSLDRDTRHREAELALRTETAQRLRAVEELRERDKLLLQQSRQSAIGEMIGNIAHQWRQPLNALGLVVQELALAYETGGLTKEHLDGSVAAAMDIIFGMSQTIDEFRNFYRPDREKRWFRVSQVIAKAVSLIEADFREHRVAIDVAVADELEIEGFPNDYAQVLLNILMNARDTLLERGTVGPRVTVRAYLEGAKSVVTIADNGGGIGEHILGRIFDLYFTTRENGLGTGIGLFMAKTIIENNMGGRLTARNAGCGAEFRIEV